VFRKDRRIFVEENYKIWELVGIKYVHTEINYGRVKGVLIRVRGRSQRRFTIFTK